MHILSYLEEKIHFNIRQFGFKKGSSTADACLLVKETANEYIKQKGKAYAAFIDLSKAFDKVDHYILGNQMLDKKMQPDMVLTLMFYLRNQSARISWNGNKGKYKYINKGVRQGGILSPFLFKFYINDLITKISNVDVECKLGFLRLNIIAYADDLVLISESCKSLEHIYVILKSDLKELKLDMNTSKTKCMIFQGSRNGCNPEILKVGNDDIEVVNDYRYLGHILNFNLNDEADIKLRLNDFYGKFNSVFRNFKYVSVETFMFLFQAYCLPDYGLSLWNAASILNKSIFKTMETAFSNSIKKILGVPLYASNHVSADICSQLLLKHHLLYVQVRYLKRIISGKNEIMRICQTNLKEGYLFKSMNKLFKDIYNYSVWDNDLDVLKSRICWVQKHETRRGICDFYGI